MSFIKTPVAVNRHIQTEAAVPVYLRVYAYLSEHCNYADGVVHAVSAAEVAEAVGCHRVSVYAAVAKLRELEWLVGGTSLSGQLAGFKSRAYKSQSTQSAVKSLVDTVAASSAVGNGTGGNRPASYKASLAEKRAFHDRVHGIKSRYVKD